MLDVGTGSGVLGLIALKPEYRISQVLGTDINPSSKCSIQTQIERTCPELQERFLTSTSDLWFPDAEPVDLCVFAPPFLPKLPPPDFEMNATHDEENWLHRAVFFEDSLFQRFFQDLPSKLKSGYFLI